MTESAKITAARIEVAKRRAALVDTAQALQARLAPATLASEAWEKAKNKGADLAEEAVDAVKARPVAATGIAAGLALFLAREPIAELAAKWWNGARSRKKSKGPGAKTRGQARNQEPTEKLV